MHTCDVGTPWPVDSNLDVHSCLTTSVSRRWKEEHLAAVAVRGPSTCAGCVVEKSPFTCSRSGTHPTKKSAGPDVPAPPKECSSVASIEASEQERWLAPHISQSNRREQQSVMLVSWEGAFPPPEELSRWPSTDLGRSPNQFVGSSRVGILAGHRRP